MKSSMQLPLFNIPVVCCLVVVLWGCKFSTKETVSESSLMSEAPDLSIPDENVLIERGKYLVNLGLCNDCHSPKLFTDHGPVPNENRLLSGHPRDLQFDSFDPELVMGGRVLMNEHFTAFAGPWGVSFAANLTPDPSGIGSWSEENFKRAIREGKFKGHPEGRDLLPPMPWEYFRKMTDEDISAIFAYLKSIKPVNNVVPAPRTFDAG